MGEPSWHRRARRQRSQDRLVVRLAKAATRLSGHHGSEPAMGGGSDGKGGGFGAGALSADSLHAVAQVLQAVVGGLGGGCGGGKGGKAKGKGKGKSSQPFQQGDWSCEASTKGGGKCGFHNFASRTVCFSCGTKWTPPGAKGQLLGLGTGARGRQNGMSNGLVGANGSKPMLARPLDRNTQSRDGFITVQQSRKPTNNRWAAFAEDQDEKDSDLSETGYQEPLDLEEYREDAGMEEEIGELDGEAGDDEVQDGAGGVSWEEEHAQEERDEGQSSNLQWLEEEHKGNVAVVQALQGRAKGDPVLVRAKEMAARSRKQLEHERQKEKGPTSVHARIRTVQRKIGNAKKKLEKLHEQRLELRQEFEEKDAGFADSVEEWNGKLIELEEQYACDCHEVAIEKACNTGQADVAKTTASIDRAGSVVQELLSQIEGEEERQLLLTVSSELEGVRTCIGQMAQGQEAFLDTGKGKVAYHDLADGESGDRDTKGADPTRVPPPASWMQQQMPSKKKQGTGKGSGGKNLWLGNVAGQFLDAGRPTHEEEVEMARRVVSMLDDKYRGQHLSEEFKRTLLDEARREMAEWIQSGGAKIHNKSSADDYLVSMDTMARCSARIEEAMVLLATKRAEAAQAAEAAAIVGT